MYKRSDSTPAKYLPNYFSISLSIIQACSQSKHEQRAGEVFKGSVGQLPTNCQKVIHNRPISASKTLPKPPRTPLSNDPTTITRSPTTGRRAPTKAFKTETNGLRRESTAAERLTIRFESTIKTGKRVLTQSEGGNNHTQCTTNFSDDRGKHILQAEADLSGSKSTFSGSRLGESASNVGSSTRDGRVDRGNVRHVDGIDSGCILAWSVGLQSRGGSV